MNSPRKEICIITAGRRASGKSTALKNIFGLPLENGAVIGDTGTIRMTNIVIGGEIYLKVIDTHGFGDLPISTKKKAGDMEKVLQKQEEYTLLYCIDVRPVNPLPLKDVDTMKALQDVLGKDVWKKCVILFTFSDTAREEYNEADTESYKTHLKDYSDAFQDALIRSCGVENLTVTTIFECVGTAMENRNIRAYTRIVEEGVPIAIAVGDTNPEEIRIECKEKLIEKVIAIPVGVTSQVEENILPNVIPNVIPNGSDWTNLVFLELMRKTECNKRMIFILLKFGNARGAQFVARPEDAVDLVVDLEAR